MMRLAALFAATVLSTSAGAEEIASVYTTIDPAADCSTFAAVGADDGGDWANMACTGYRGYPIIIHYSDARESVFYGFPPDGDLAPSWESFGGFNSTAPTVEWRVLSEGGVETPFATIHRWFVADPDDDENPIQVLVVEKVGQIHERLGCVVGYVMATGNPDHNARARVLADEEARGFVCGEDEPFTFEGKVPLPMPARG
jgi:hypothetical protein